MADHLSILNPSPAKVPGPETLHLLVKSSIDTPTIAAEYLSSSDSIESLTYRDLHERSDRLAKQLIVALQTLQSPGSQLIIPLYIPQCLELYIAQLAILKAGGAFCPIALDAPLERIRFIVQDVKATIVLTTSELRRNIPAEIDASVFIVDEKNSEPTDGPHSKPLNVDIKPSQPAYVMYTSGSTGTPKGVVISHLAASQAILAHDRHIPRFSRFLQFANPTFDVSVFEIFFPLFRGSTLICCDRRLLLSDLPSCIRRLNVDAAELTPSVASSLLHTRNNTPSLKLLLTIGEMLRQDVVEEFAGSKDREGILYGMYGPTEATIHCTLQANFHSDMPVGNIGQPLETVSALIVKPQTSQTTKNDEVEIVPIGEEGELAVGGHQLALGYLNRDEQTKAAFVSHPKYGRLYRTGDKARLLSNGRLECRGRISAGQVKLRGQRIELGEIENAASRTEGCRTAVVEIVNGAVVAFCVGHGSLLSPGSIRKTCRSWLPAFMVPGDVVVLDALPYLSSGKVDRKALRTEYLSQKDEVKTTQAPLTPQMQKIVTCMSSVLQTPIHPETLLVSTGLDSLSSIRIASQLRLAGLPQINAMSLLDARTVKDIESISHHSETSVNAASGTNSFARLALRLREAAKDNPVLSSHADEIDDVFPATALQSAMLVETSKNTEAYCNWVDLAVDKIFGISDVHESIAKLAVHHQMLRSGFLETGDAQAAHAVIVWKSLLPSQIALGHCSRDLRIEDEYDLLRPCRFYLDDRQEGLHILLQIHHALYDQWSIDNLRADLSALLRGLDIIPRPPFRMLSEYHLLQVHSEPSLDFFEDHLRDISVTKFPRIVGQHLPCQLRRTERRQIDVNLPSLRRKARGLDCTLPSAFQAAFTWLLGCYTGDPDVLCGVVFSGRHLPLPDIDKLFGPCLATLPSRINCSAVRTCADLIKLVYDQNKALQRHSSIPLAAIKRLVQIPPDVPLFDTLFLWQESTVDLAQETIVITEFDTVDQHEFNLVLEFEPVDDKLKVRGTFQNSLISYAQVDLLLQQICTVAIQLLHHANGLVEDLGKCLASEMLSVSNPSPSSCAQDLSLITNIERHAKEAPDSQALIFANDIKEAKAQSSVLSYSDLNGRANKLAHYLGSLQHSKIEPICICMEKSPDLYIAILASMKVGSGYLPLVPETPSSRIASITRQAQVRICLCDNTTVASFHLSQEMQVMNISELSLDNFSAQNLRSDPYPSGIAYVVFTSGSTGEPKGVPVTKQNLLGNLGALSQLYRVQPGDRLLQACSQAFDVSVFEIFFAFYNGITLCSATKDILFQDLENSIRALRISHLSLTPTVAALIEPDNVPSVKFLVTAGEGVTDLVHKQWAGRGLHQGYGPSETTNICTINMNMSFDSVLGNIGQPFNNTSAFVLSPGSRSVILPIGSLGEFAFGGEQVFPGYLCRNDLNSEKLIDLPGYDRVYKSGDMGRILPDGSLLISGRVDDQVKVRGNRIELGEINAILLQDARILDCKTLVVDTDVSGEVLVSFVVYTDSQRSESGEILLNNAAEGAISRLFERLEDTLPAYMVPSTIVPINKLPLTSQGKLDRRFLQQFFTSLNHEVRAGLSRSSEGADMTNDWSPTEKLFAMALAEVLNISPSLISKHSSFFSLGLNSLNAIAFAKRLSNIRKTTVTVSNVLKNPAIARLARAMDFQQEKQQSESTTALLDAQPWSSLEDIRNSAQISESEIDFVLPCTPLQEAMLSASTSKTGSPYCNSMVLDVTGDIPTLWDCWQTMCERHAILRTQFVQTTSVSHPYAQVVLKQKTLSRREYYHDDKDRLAQAVMSSCQTQEVDYSNPFRIDLHNGESDTKMILHMHHSIYDGISVQTLLQEVEQNYHNIELLPPVPYEPFLAHVYTQSDKSSESFWSKHLDQFTPNELPKSVVSFQRKEEILASKLAICDADLDSFCKHHAISQLSIFQAALFKILESCQQRQDLCFGNVVSGRNVPVKEVHRLVAPCFNTIPLRMNLADCRNNIDLAKKIHETNIAAMDYQLTPLRRIQALSKDPSKHLFSCLLILQPPAPSRDDRIWKFEKDCGDMGLPLCFEIIPSGNSFRLEIHHSLDFISFSLACNLSDAFASALSNILKYPFGHLREFLDLDNDDIAGSLVMNDPVNGDVAYDESSMDQEWTDTELRIRQVFADLATIDISRIKKNTSMYQIGLDSLNVHQIVSRLERQKVQVDAADVMENLNPFLIARVASEKTTKNSEAVASIDIGAYDRKYRETVLKQLGVPSETIQAIRPCTPVQNGMIGQSVSSNGMLYINHLTYRVPPLVTLEDIANAWTAVQENHQVLHMGFHRTEDHKCPFAMVIRHAGSSPAPVQVFKSDKGFNTIEAEVAAMIMEKFHTHPWQISLQQSRTGTTMTVSLHHALYDADSLRVILADFTRALSSDTLDPVSNIDSLLSSTLRAAVDPDGSSAKFWQENLKEAVVSRFPDLSPCRVAERSMNSVYTNCSTSVLMLENFCKEESATIQALGQTIWALLLAQYHGNARVTFGTTFSGRSSEAHQVAFASITTVPIACNAGIAPSRLLKEMVDFNASLQRHRFVPLADIQRYAGDAIRSLFDTIFVYQKPQSHESTMFDWPLLTETAAVDYTASFELEPTTKGDILLRLTYDTSRIPEDHAQLILRQYDHLMMMMISRQSNETTYDAALYSIQPALASSLDTDINYLHEFVERGARQHPDRVALEFIDSIESDIAQKRIWTYRALDKRANQVADLICQRGIEPESVIAVSMEKCPEASFAFVGILKAGCSFLAMDPDLPEARVNFILQDSGAQLLLVGAERPGKELRASTPTIKLTEKLLDQFVEVKANHGLRTTQGTCYCLYTSGTTGTPKGCEITHENAVQAMLAFQRLFAGRWDNESRWLQFASYWFDVSVLEHFWSWSVGIAVVGAPRDLVLNDIPGFIRQMKITHIDLTPSLARLVIPESVPSLWNGVFITGGEALKQEIIDAWGPKTTICNGYGPTEATIGVTMNPFLASDAKPFNIGTPFDNVGAYVLQPSSDQPVLRGCVGELCVSGRLVGKGYLNRPDLTRKAFPHLSLLNERVYRTGDLVRFSVDGSVLFIGRQDSQAKLRGQRLEIGEIDHVVQNTSNDISEVVSLVVKGNNDRETLISFFTMTDHAQKSEPEIVKSGSAKKLLQTAKAVCKDRLPGYMVPTHILPVDVLPLTVNNKVDIKKLVALFNRSSKTDLQSLSGNDSDYRSSNETEKRIAAVLASLLKIDSEGISPSSNTFSLGLSSISAIQFSSALRREGFNHASIATVINKTTIEKLATALTAQPANREVDNEHISQAKLLLNAFSQRYRHIVARSLDADIDQIESVAPCTPLQQGILVDSFKEAGTPYFNTFRYSIADIDLSQLQQAFATLIDHSQILRTKFVDTDEGYAQVVFHQGQVQIPCRESTVAASRLDRYQRDQKLAWLHQNERNLVKPFEIHLIRTTPSNILIIHIHHALYDGISFDLMMDKISLVYNGHKGIEFGPEFHNVLPYGPFYQGHNSEEFWRKRLKDYEFTPLENSMKPGNPEQVASVVLNFKSVSSLEVCRKTLGVSHQALVQACFESALFEYSPNTQTFGMVVSGRTVELDKAEYCIGPLFNTLPQPLSIASNATWSDHARTCHDLNTQAISYQHTSLRDIRKWCGSDASDPMFDILFVFQYKDDSQLKDSNALFKPLEEPLRADYPLVCEVDFQAGGGMTISLLAQEDVVDQAGLKAISNSFEKGLQRVCTDRDSLIRDLFPAVVHKHRTAQRKLKTRVQTNGLNQFQWSNEASSMRAIIADLAGINAEDVDEHTSILALGLDSIDAVKLSSRFQTANILIPVSKILKTQTISGMMEVFEPIELPNGAPKSSHISLHALESKIGRLKLGHSIESEAEIQRILPATPHQEALIFGMVHSNFNDYFNHDVLQLNTDVDVERFRAAWQAVVDGSSILRTSFVEIADPEIDMSLAQVVHEPQLVDFRPVTLSSPAKWETVLEDIRHDVGASWQRLAPFRLTLVALESERYLVLSLAHALYDGHSLALLHEDVQRAYVGTLASRPSYDHLIDESLSSVSEEARRFWSDTMTGTSVHPFPQMSGFESGSKTHRLERASNLSAARTQAFCKEHGVSMPSFAQTCWALVLASYTRSLDVTFGTVLACRDSEEAEQVMFPSMNTVVVRAFLHGNRGQMVQHIQRTMADILPYQRTPLRFVQSACKNIRREGPSRAEGLFDTLFIYQHRPTDDANLGQPLYKSVYGGSNVEYPVAVEIEAINEEIVIRAACKSHVLDLGSTEKLVNKLEDVMNAIVDAPNGPTVSFKEECISVCGLPSFQSQDSSFDGYGKKSILDNDEEISSIDSLPMLDTVKKVLAQVSQTSAEDFSDLASIESIGIDSISAIKVSALLRKADVNLSVSDIIKSKTAMNMAKVASSKTLQASNEDIEAKNTIDDTARRHKLKELPSRFGIDPANVEEILPATAGQLYTISMWMKTHGQLFYPTFTYRPEKSFGFAQIQQAWAILLSRHTILRTVFCNTENTDLPLAQVVLKQAPAKVFRGDESIATGVAHQPFVSLQVKKDRHCDLVLLSIHHALYDAISLPLLMDDLGKILESSPTLAPTRIHKEFLALSSTPKAVEERRQFWKSYLCDARPLQLLPPSVENRPQETVELFRPGFFTACTELQRLARANDVTTQALLFAACAKVYAKLGAAAPSGPVPAPPPPDVVFAIYLSNRSHLPDLATLAAPTVNQLPLRVRSPEAAGLLEIARGVQADLSRIAADATNSAASLQEIYSWTGVKVDLFVNFLKLPGPVEESEPGLLSPVDDERLAERRRVLEPKGAATGGRHEVPVELRRDLGGSGAYQHSVDLELTVTDDRADIGIFSPAEMVGLGEAEDVLVELRRLLEDFVGKPTA